MGKKLYVGNLSYSVNNQSLTDLFAQFGTVESARIVTDRETNRSKGFGFVEMSSDEEALAAIEKLNGNPFEGRNLTVSEARPKEEGAPRSGGFRPGGNRGGGDRGERRQGGFGGNRGGNRDY